jgi:hypothetical protein
VLARDVLVVISSYADKATGEAWPSIRTIAATLYVGEHAVKKAIRELVGVGIVKTFRRNRRLGESNLYRLALREYERFQGTDSVTRLNGDRAGLGDRFSPVQVADSVRNQVRASCSNGAKNIPDELTTEPSSPSLRSGDAENGNEDGFERFRAFGKKLGWTA